MERKKNCGPDCASSEYEVILPTSVADMSGDLGVYRVETSGGETLYRIRPSEKRRIYNLKFSGPSKRRGVYYRHKTRDKKEGSDLYTGTDKLVIIGSTYSFKENGKVNMWLIPDDSTDLDPDSDYPVDSSLIPTLLERVEAVGRRTLGTLEDLENDGKQ